MSDAFNHNVWGADGFQPSYLPQGLWTTWNINQIWTGEDGKNRYVPKVLDHLVEPLSNTRYRVTAVDQTTLLCTYTLIPGTSASTVSAVDQLFSTGPGYPSQTHRIYLDDTVFPHRLDVDTFMLLRAVNVSYAKIIHGPVFGENTVVSKVYDSGGTFLTDRVGLELASIEGSNQNLHMKNVKTCFCTSRFENGDTLTVVLYSADGHMLSHMPLTVVNSNVMRQQNAPLKYITDISLKSPYLSPTNPSLLLLPVGWTSSSMNIEGQVHYSDGQVLPLPIDGRKFYLDGLDQVLSTIPGHDFDMVLRYVMDSTEASTQENSVYSHSIPKPIRVRLVDQINSIVVKLYAYPVWNTQTSAYELKFYMFNKERNIYRDVTGSVRFAANSAVFNGYLFGAVQRLQISLSLRDVIPTSIPYTHTQIMEVSLFGTPADFPTPWVVKHVLNDPVAFGGALKALRFSNDSVKIDSNIATFAEWRDRLYVKTYPLMDIPEDAASLIEPTHFDILYRGGVNTYPISSWNQALDLAQPILRFRTLMIVFKRQTSSGPLYLSMASLMIQNSP